MLLFTTFSLIIGFTLYLLQMWSPGDAKLFTAYTSLLPLTIYQHITTIFWPLEILINSFIPIAVFLLIQIIIKTTTKQKMTIIKTILNPKQITQYLLTIFSIGWITSLMLGHYGINDFLLSILIITLISTLLKKIYPYELNYLLALIAILRIFVNKDQMILPQFWIGFLIMTMMYMLIITIINNLGSLFITSTDINHLKEGMIPTQGITQKKQEYERIMLNTNNPNMIYQTKPGGLTKEDIKKIQNLHRTGKLHFNHILTQQTIPFATYMIIGTIITIVSQGNLIIFIRTIF